MTDAPPFRSATTAGSPSRRADGCREGQVAAGAKHIRAEIEKRKAAPKR